MTGRHYSLRIVRSVYFILNNKHAQIVTEGSQGWLGANGNRADSVMAQASLTVTGKTETDTKVEHSEPTVRVRCGRRLSDKSYLGDNRLVAPKRP